MTREEAIKAIQYVIEDYRGTRDQLVGPWQALVGVINTLAPVIRRKPPTVEEVGDEALCWVYYETARQWGLRCGETTRREFGLFYAAWLPYSAIPEGGA